MSWRTDLIQARARLARLEAAEEAALSGRSVEQISAAGESVKYAQRATSLGDLQRSIRETQVVIARLSGVRLGGVITPVMGG